VRCFDLADRLWLFWNHPDACGGFDLNILPILFENYTGHFYLVTRRNTHIALFPFLSFVCGKGYPEFHTLDPVQEKHAPSLVFNTFDIDVYLHKVEQLLWTGCLRKFKSYHICPGLYSCVLLTLL
jgi:hypothetical protein